MSSMIGGLTSGKLFHWRLLRAAANKRRGVEGKSKVDQPATSQSATEEKSAPAKSPTKHHDSMRETVESVVIAFVLAFLFRTFLAEAFVIPTGSMAPTLMGRHKDFACSQCGHHYTVGASEEVNRETGVLERRLTNSTCPNCSFTNNVFNDSVFNGDRILVNKFPYELKEPDRFDVFVFRFPDDPQTNYIKRLVGLPGESLRIDRGDLYAKKGTQGEYEILRKADPNKQRVLQQTVYDDQQPPTLLLKHGFPERWASLEPNAASTAQPEWLPKEDGWQQDATKRSFQIQAGGDWNWLRYRHLMPTEQDWDRALDGETPNREPQPKLIADFCPYNAEPGEFRGGTPDAFWSGDLTLNAFLDVRQLSGTSPGVQLELVAGVRRYLCEFDLRTGVVTLSRTDDLKADGSWVELAQSKQGIQGTGRHSVTFANVDQRLCLWIDNRLIPFGRDAEYPPTVIRDPQIADLHPVGVAAKDVDMEVSRLVIERDIYYRAVKDGWERDAEGDIGRQLARLLSDPQEYNRVYNEKSRSVEFEALNDDEYFAMGDNSAKSYDGRLWRKRGTEHSFAVNRRALIGKAFFVYWPHGVPFLNNGKGFPLFMHSVPKDSAVKNYPLYSAPFYPQWWRWSRIR